MYTMTSFRQQYTTNGRREVFNMTEESDFLTSEVKKAYADLKAAENYFDNVADPDLVDFAIYDIEAAKKSMRTC